MTIFTKPVSNSKIETIVRKDAATLLAEMKAKADAAWQAELTLRAMKTGVAF